MAAALLSALLSLTAAQMPASLETPAFAASDSVTFTQFDSSVNGGEPIRGVDISSIIAIENAGVVFCDDLGNEQDIFKTLAEHGVNYIRVRVWNDPYDSSGNSYGGGNNDVYTAGLIGARAAKYGMKLLVDIQYSDFWADPAKQTRPKYWAEHDLDTLGGEIYKWTTWVLTSVTEAGGDIGMVQVGNETNCHFCGEDDMYSICKLFASGNKAVRDFDSSILIAHHFADPSTGNYPWYAKVMDECGLDYDVFATSYYPYWHGTTDNLTSVLKNIGDTYGKYVMVAETAYPYTSDDGDTFGNVVSASSADCEFRYDISVEGQAQCLTDVFQAVADTGKWGLGAFYWEPAWLGVPGLSWEEQIQLWEQYGSGWATASAAGYDPDVTGTGGSSYDNQALFDFSGKPLASLDVFSRVYPQTERVFLRDGSEIAEGAYRIKNAETGLYLTVANADGRAGGNVIQYSADGAADYNTWFIKSADDGYYFLYYGADDSGLLLDLDSGKPDDRTNIGIYTRTDSDAQLFKFVAQDDGSYLIVTGSSKDRSAVGVSGSGDGANAHQLRVDGSRSQTWVLEPVEEYSISGDLNGDEVIDIFDLILMRQCLVSHEFPDAADANGDGSANVADLVTLQSFILGMKGMSLHEHGTPRNTIFPRI
ncbi:MAG: glycosyl hydrolase 53 family protein [Ruminococcus sp.]|nr:glycosyl hydrolase 53 family protein [Ruminococcus sp.]